MNKENPFRTIPAPAECVMDFGQSFRFKPMDDMTLAELIRISQAYPVWVNLTKAMRDKIGPAMRHFEREGQ